MTSISADTHKFGYALKGTSVLLYRNSTLRRYQYFSYPDWPGGIYMSPGLSGSRSGGIVAAAWAAMLSLGEEGYLEIAERIFETAATILEGIADIPELEVFGDPTFIIAFRGRGIDIYHVNDFLITQGLASQRAAAAARAALLRDPPEHRGRHRRGIPRGPARCGRVREDARPGPGDKRRALRTRRITRGQRGARPPVRRRAGRDVRRGPLRR